jgi:hypothetical protein
VRASAFFLQEKKRRRVLKNFPACLAKTRAAPRQPNKRGVALQGLGQAESKSVVTATRRTNCSLPIDSGCENTRIRL